MPVHTKPEGAEGTADHDDEFSKDLLRKAEEIAEFLLGDRKLRRKIYHLVATSNLPVFKLGSTICARKSVLLRWVRDQEDRRAGLAARSEEHGRIDS
jgi:hypothetical protein